MNTHHKFIDLAKGLGVGVRDLRVASWPKETDGSNSFRWFNADFGPGGRAQKYYCLHFEILEGDGYSKEIKDKSGEQLYSPGVAYVELHLEWLEPYLPKYRSMIEKIFQPSIEERIKDGRYKNCLFIPNWQDVGFSVRYLCGKDNHGGIPFASAVDLNKVRDELGKRMVEFVKLMEPWIEECKKIFKQEEKSDGESQRTEEPA